MYVFSRKTETKLGKKLYVRVGETVGVVVVCTGVGWLFFFHVSLFRTRRGPDAGAERASTHTK